jgi:tRNA threonylcarbamoyladenosine biosynthesis protein TsaE
MKTADLVLISRSPEATENIGRLLVNVFIPGDVVSLDGDLGAGKTALTRGIAAGMDCQGPVASPTFTLLMEHAAGPGGLALYHFDVYRLRDSADFCDIGLDEYFDRAGVCVVEWGSLIADALPLQTLQIELHQVDPEQPDLRRIEISWPGQPERLAALAMLMTPFEEGKTC